MVLSGKRGYQPRMGGTAQDKTVAMICDLGCEPVNACWGVTLCVCVCPRVRACEATGWVPAGIHTPGPESEPGTPSHAVRRCVCVCACAGCDRPS